MPQSIPQLAREEIGGPESRIGPDRRFMTENDPQLVMESSREISYPADLLDAANVQVGVADERVVLETRHKARHPKYITRNPAGLRVDGPTGENAFRRDPQARSSIVIPPTMSGRSTTSPCLDREQAYIRHSCCPNASSIAWCGRRTRG